MSSYDLYLCDFRMMILDYVHANSLRCWCGRVYKYDDSDGEYKILHKSYFEFIKTFLPDDRMVKLINNDWHRFSVDIEAVESELRHFEHICNEAEFNNSARKNLSWEKGL